MSGGEDGASGDGPGGDGAGGDETDPGHRNLISFSRALTGWGQRGGLRQDDGVLAFASGSWLPVGGNGAFRLRDSVPPGRVLDVAEEFFPGRKRGYGIKVRDTGQDDDLRAACEDRGIAAFGEPAPQMMCRQPLPVPHCEAGVQLRRVDDAGGVADFVAVNAEAYGTYGMPNDVAGHMFDRPEAMLADPRTAIVVAYRDAMPLATALVFCSDGTAGLQWVGTRPEARRLGLGAAVTVWATNEAFERGANECTLQASPMGEPVYRALGYETLYHYVEHVRWRASGP